MINENKDVELVCKADDCLHEWETDDFSYSVSVRVKHKLQALVYDILPS